MTYNQACLEFAISMAAEFPAIEGGQIALFADKVLKLADRHQNLSLIHHKHGFTESEHIEFYTTIDKKLTRLIDKYLKYYIVGFEFYMRPHSYTVMICLPSNKRCGVPTRNYK